MGGGSEKSVWQSWVSQPQRLWLRRALFQVHLWSGVILGLYVLMISVTGSVLVYSNELFRAASAKPVLTKGTGPRLSDAQLMEAAKRIYPAYRVAHLGRASDPDQAVDVRLQRGQEIQHRLFDPRTGQDLGNAIPVGIQLISWLMDLHDNLFGGPTGRRVNGVAAAALLAIGFTGIVIWWPGKKTWRRSLKVPLRARGKGIVWHLHSMVGFWSFGFFVVFMVSGIYLGFPDQVQDLADRIQPLTAANMRTRIVDRIIYWMAYLHFGRICGIGIPCRGPGLCDQATKATWAFFGLMPAVMFVTGLLMWWNRVLRPKWRALELDKSAGSSLSSMSSNGQLQ